MFSSKPIALSFVFLALSGILSSVSAATWWGSPTGSGTACSEASPCSWSTCINTADAPGDECVLKDGTYNVTSRVETKHSGTVADPIVIRAENRRQALFQATGAFDSNREPLLQIDHSNVTIRGLRFDGNNLAHWGLRRVTAGSTSIKTGIIVEDCEFTNFSGVGIGLQNVNGMIFRHSRIDGTGYRGGVDQCCGSMMYMGDPNETVPVTNFEVYNNVFRDATDNLLDFKGGNQDSHVHHNIFETHRNIPGSDFGGDGQIRGGGSNGSGNIVENNIIRDMPVAEYGIRLEAAHYTVRNNTFYNIGGSPFVNGNPGRNDPSNDYYGNITCNATATEGAQHDAGFPPNQLDQPQAECDAEVDRIIGKPRIGSCEMGSAGANILVCTWENIVHPPLTAPDNTKFAVTYNGVAQNETGTTVVDNTVTHTTLAAAPNGQTVQLTASAGAVTNSARIGGLVGGINGQNATQTVTAQSSSGGIKRYASPTGSGTSCANINTPCTLNTAANQAQAGETVILLNGTYNQKFTTVRAGTVSQPITFQAQNRRQAIIRWPESGDGSGAEEFFHIAHSNIRIIQLEIWCQSSAGGATWNCVRVGSNAGVRNNIVFHDNYVHDAGHMLFGCFSANNVEISHNRFHRSGHSSEDGENFYLSSATANTHPCTNLHIHHNHGTFFTSNAIDHKDEAKNIITEYNFFEDMVNQADGFEGDGIVRSEGNVDGSTGNIFRKNVVRRATPNEALRSQDNRVDAIDNVWISLDANVLINPGRAAPPLVVDGNITCPSTGITIGESGYGTNSLNRPLSECNTRIDTTILGRPRIASCEIGNAANNVVTATWTDILHPPLSTANNANFSVTYTGAEQTKTSTVVSGASTTQTALSNNATPGQTVALSVTAVAVENSADIGGVGDGIAGTNISQTITCANNVTTSEPPGVFVSPGGTGTACSDSTPCSVSTGQSQVTSGETLVFKDGIYNNCIETTKAGIIYKAQNEQQAIIRDTGNACSTQGTVFEILHSNTTIDGLHIDGQETDGGSHGTVRWGASVNDIAIRNSVIEDSSGMLVNICGSISNANCSNVVIEDNILRRSGFNSLQGEAIYIGQSEGNNPVNNVDIRRNLIQGVGCEQALGIKPGVTNVEATLNIFEDQFLRNPTACNFGLDGVVVSQGELLFDDNIVRNNNLSSPGSASALRLNEKDGFLRGNVVYGNNHGGALIRPRVGSQASSGSPLFNASDQITNPAPDPGDNTDTNLCTDQIFYFNNNSPGSDSNDCLSPATACKSMAEFRATSLGPGDCALFAGNSTWTDEDPDWEGRPSGTAGNPVVFGAYGMSEGVARPKWVYTGDAAAENFDGQQWKRFDRLHMDGTDTWRFRSGTHDFTLISTRFDNCENACLSWWHGTPTSTHNFLLDGIHINTSGPPGALDGTGEGFYMGAGTDLGTIDSIIIRNCMVENAGNEAVSVKIRTSQVLVEDCLLQNNRSADDPGIINTSNADPGAAITIRRVVVRNNNREAGTAHAAVLLGRDTKFSNSIVHNNTNASAFAGESDSFFLHNTTYENDNGFLHSGNATPDANIKGNIGSTITGNIAASAGLFVNAATDDFRLAPGSAALDLYANCQGITDDIAGTSRPQGTNCDAGAFEFATGITEIANNVFCDNGNDTITGNFNTHDNTFHPGMHADCTNRENEILALIGGQEPPPPPPPGQPYADSTFISDVTWNCSSLTTGAAGADQFPTTWGQDGHLYLTWGDGGGFESPLDSGEGKSSLGVSRLTGTPSSIGAEDILCDQSVCATNPASDGVNPDSWSDVGNGGKASALVAVGSRLYAWLNTQDVAFPNSTFRLMWSDDNGAHWTLDDETFGGGPPALYPDSFVQRGQANNLEQDGYVYTLAYNRWDDQATQQDIYMYRMPVATITDKTTYEYYSGTSTVAAWSSNAADRQPIFTDENHVGATAQMSYIPGIDRYLIAVPHWIGGDVNDRGIGLFESPNPWGPWRTATYHNTDWCGQRGHINLGYSIPTKTPEWLSTDGLTFHVIYSGTGTFDQYQHLQGTLTLAEPPPPPPENLLIAHLPFDGTLTDAVGNVTPTYGGGGSPAYVSGVDGSALQLDGDNFVTLETHSIIGTELYPAAGNPFSVAFFYKLSEPVCGTLVASATATPADRDFQVFLQTDTIDTYLQGTRSVSPAVQHFDGQWHHGAVVWNGQTAALYTDGAFASNLTVGASAEDTLENIIVGGRTGGAEFPFTGAIDDVRIYNYGLGASEVATLAEALPDEETNISTGLVAHWTFDETLNDASPVGGTPLTHSDAPVYVPGQINEALALDGIEFANTNKHAIEGTRLYAVAGNPFSVSGWVKTTATGTLVASAVATTTDRDFQIAIQPNLDIYMRGSTTRVAASLGDDNWHHIVVTWDGAVGKVYLDNVLVRDNLPIGTSAEDTGENIIIGARTGGTGYRLTGAVDDVRIYNIAIDQNVVNALFTLQPGEGDVLPPSVPGPLQIIQLTSNRLDLSWAPSTDDGGGTIIYRIESCDGAACVDFAQIGTTTASQFMAAGLTPGTLYRFRVRAEDGSQNLSDYSNIVEASTLTAGRRAERSGGSTSGGFFE